MSAIEAGASEKFSMFTPHTPAPHVPPARTEQHPRYIRDDILNQNKCSSTPRITCSFEHIFQTAKLVRSIFESPRTPPCACWKTYKQTSIANPWLNCSTASKGFTVKALPAVEEFHKTRKCKFAMPERRIHYRFAVKMRTCEAQNAEFIIRFALKM